MAVEPGLRERKKIERRERIENAALELFEQHGFDATTVEAIAAAADIAPRTFFSYFATKEDVVLADYALRLERITDELANRPDDEAPWAALRASFVEVASDYEQWRGALIRRFTIIAANPAVHARSLQLQAGWEDAVAGILARRSGNGPDDIEPAVMASAALGCMRSSLRLWFAGSHRQPLPELVDRCFEELAAGLAGT